MPLYSNRRFDPYGTAALYRMMQRRTEWVTTLERPRLEDEHRGVMIQVLSLADEAWYDEFGDEIDNPYHLPTPMLLDWIADGNTLIQMTRRRTPVMESLGIDFAEDPESGVIQGVPDWAEHLQEQQLKGVPPNELDTWEVSTRWRSAQERSGTSNRSVLLHAPRELATGDLEGWQPRLWSGGIAYGGEIEYGRGRVVVVGSPSPTLNYYLGERENLSWLIEMLGEDSIVFDEWAHGVGHGGTIIETLAHFGLIPVLLQVPVWLMCYRWSTAGRRTAVDHKPLRQRSGRDQIDTLGRLYEHAWSLGERRRRVYDEVLTRFAAACRCLPAEVEARLRNRSDAQAVRALTLIREARGLALVERPCCVSCGYALSGLKTNRCPECGALIPRRVTRLMERPDSGIHSVDDAKPNARDSALGRILDHSSSLAQELKRV
ncbi:MAG: DUF4350 domain-containing protein [Planctomycetota bacterium]